MVDVHEPKVRSYNMSQIRGKDTKPEMIVRRFLFKNGFRYRLHDRKLPGRPDLVFSKYKKVIFIHGCFWHGHEDCKYFKPPKTKTDWWMNKISENRNRDERNIVKLKKDKWLPITIWECELKPDKRDKTLQALVKELLN